MASAGPSPAIDPSLSSHAPAPQPSSSQPTTSSSTTTATTATTTTATSFPFPREYHFPAFFTRQTNLTTHHAQLTKWSALVLAYARHHRLFRLHLSAAADSELFRNRRIDRRLAPRDIRDVVDFLRRDGRAEYLGGNGNGYTNSSSSNKDAGDVALLYWRKPDEWAALVEAYVDETGQKGGVLTLYELIEGEATRGTELHGMDGEVLLKALNVLVKRGKAQIFGQEDSLGVKFF